MRAIWSQPLPVADPANDTHTACVVKRVFTHLRQPQMLLKLPFAVAALVVVAYLLVTGSDDAPLVWAVFALALISNGIDVAWWSFSRLRHSRSSLPSR